MTDFPAVTWCSVDLKSGRRGQTLITQTQGVLKRIIGEPTDGSQAVRIWDTDNAAPIPGALAATLPGRTMLVALDDEDQPLWGGLVLRRKSKGAGSDAVWVSLDMATLEHYFDRRYTGDLTFVHEDQVAIAAAVIDNVAVDGLNFTIEAATSGVFRDRAYFDDEDKTALTNLGQLIDIENGIEFTIELRWADEDHMVLERVVVLRQRIGTSPVVPVRFELPGPVVDFDMVEDYTGDFGANDVMATSSGEGDLRPESAHQVAAAQIANGWARFESRFSPSTSITDVSTLNAHAADRVARTADGLTQFTLEANLDAAPRLGRDFHLGDDLTAVFTCPRFPPITDVDGQVGPGYEHTVRCTGWELDLNTRRLKPTVTEVD